MRHDPAAGALVIMLRSLKMHGMAQAVDELAQQGAPAFKAAIPVLSQLLKAKTAEREVRFMAYQFKASRFPAYRDLAGFDFASSEVNEALVRQLHRCDLSSPRTMSCSLAGLELARRILLPHSACRPLSTTKACPLLLNRRTGQCPGAGKSPGSERPDCRPPNPRRSRHS
jgi:hypothetical protein